MLKVHLIVYIVNAEKHQKEVVRKIARFYLLIRCKTYVNVKNLLAEGTTSKINSLRKLLHKINL